MLDKQKVKIQTLELIVRLKSLILKATNVDDLLSQICIDIVQIDVCDVSWAVLLDKNNENPIKYSSHPSNTSKVEYLCWKDSLASPKVFIHSRDDLQCKSCVLSNNENAILVSKRLEHDGNIYGVFSVSIEKEMFDKDVEKQFSDFVDDISFVIYAIRLKEKNKRIQQELNESKRTYLKLLETSAIPVGILDLESRVIFMSASLKKLLGYDEDDETYLEKGITAADAVAKEEQERVKASLKLVLEKDVINTNDYIFMKKNGVKFHMRIRTSLIRDAKNNPSGFMVVFHDLSTELKTAEALRISEEQFRLLFMKAPNGVSFLSPRGVIIDCNERDAEILKVKREDLIGTHVKSYLTEEFQRLFEKNFEDFIKTKSIIVKLKRKDGSVVTVARNVSALYNKEGDLSGIIVHTRDVTEEMEAQFKVKLLSSAIEQSSSIFTITDLDGRITYVNRRFEEVTGWTLDEVKGHNPNILRSGLLPNKVYKDMWDRLKSGRIWKGELSNKKKDGTLYWEYASMSSIRNEDGEITNMLKVAEDITVRKQTERELNDLTVRYRNVFNTAPNPIVIHINGSIVDVNRSAILFAGANGRKDLLGRNIMDFIHESSRKEILNQIRVLNKGAKILPFDAVFLTLKGERRDVRTASNIISFGGEQAYMVFFEDITARKQTELDLKEAIERYHNIFELSPTPIVIHREGIIVDFNEAAFEFSKYDNKDILLNKPIFQFIHESSREEVGKRIKKLKEGAGKLDAIEENFVNGLGELRNVITLSKGVTYKGEQAFMVVFEDITERKKSEQKLIESEKRFRNFFNLIPDPVLITNFGKGVFIEANDSALKLVNMTHEEAIGKSVFDFGLYKNIDDRERLLHRIIKKGYVFNEELEVKLYGNDYTFLVSARIIEPVDKQNILFVAHDITARKKMEFELVKSKEKAEASEKLKSSFLSNMSHEIRTPMNAILGFSDLLRDSELDATHRDQYINIIQQRGGDLLKMIGDIMDISKIESNSLDISHRAVRIKSLVQDVVETIRVKLEKDASKTLKLLTECRIDNDLLVNGDKYRIRQVLTNLLDNAVKFTTEGSVVFRCWLEDKHVLFEIEDSGCGIAEDKIGLIFQHFVQVHDIRDVSIGGAGLGLSISKSLLNLMGGDIWVSSQLGKGSVFSFSLNVFDGMGGNFDDSVIFDGVEHDWSGKTILIAEDEPSNQIFIKVILGKTKANLIMANDGEEAITIFDKQMDEIDLVIVDVKMPKINGYQLTRYIKEQKPDLPVVALTANAMNNDREEALKNGCDDYLAKPIAKELLYSTLEKFL
jgi:PAS domain S-box-containing protein